jgi:two-component system sensor histidine kinase ChiS
MRITAWRRSLLFFAFVCAGLPAGAIDWTAPDGLAVPPAGSWPVWPFGSPFGRADDFFNASVSGLRPGTFYLLEAPDAKAVHLSASAVPASSSGRALIFRADTTELAVALRLGGPWSAPAVALAGFAATPLRSWWLRGLFLDAALLLCLALGLAAWSVAGADGRRRYWPVWAATVLAAAAAAAAASLPAVLNWSSDLRGAISWAGILVLLAAVGVSPALARAWRIAALACAAALAAGTVVFGWPPALGLGAFAAAAALPAVGTALWRLVDRRRRAALTAAVAGLPQVLAAVACFSSDPRSAAPLVFVGAAAYWAFQIGLLRPAPAGADCESYLSDYADTVATSLSRFIPQEFLSILDKPNVSQLQLGDHIQKDMTIFFSDIRQFTNLSETLTPEENFKFINSYLSRVVPLVNEHGGFVDKYMGDAILALFPKEGGADEAVRAAIDIQLKMIEYNGHRANSGYRPLSMGIGLHTGALMLGVVGVSDRMENTVISDAVNVASRLESITKVFNVPMAISEATFKSLRDPGAYMYRFIGKVRVKGKNEPISVFEIFDGLGDESVERKMRANRFFEQGMLNYYQKDFSGALFFFRKVLEILPDDGAAAFYLDNCMAKAHGF